MHSRLTGYLSTSPRLLLFSHLLQNLVQQVVSLELLLMSLAASFHGHSDTICRHLIIRINIVDLLWSRQILRPKYLAGAS